MATIKFSHALTEDEARELLSQWDAAGRLWRMLEELWLEGQKDDLGAIHRGMRPDR